MHFLKVRVTRLESGYAIYTPYKFQLPVWNQETLYTPSSLGDQISFYLPLDMQHNHLLKAVPVGNCRHLPIELDLIEMDGARD